MAALRLAAQPATENGFDAVEFGDVTVFAGAPTARDATHHWQNGNTPSDGYLVLIHASQNGERIRPIADDIYLVTSNSAFDWIRHERRRVVGAAVRRARLPQAPSPVTELTPTPLVRASRWFLASLLGAFEDENSPPSLGAEDITISLVRRITRETAEVRSGHSASNSVDAKVAELIDANHRDPQFDVDTIARHLHFSRRQLYRLVKPGVGLAERISERRLLTATRLMESRPRLPLGDVATMAGFSNLASLRAQMVSRYGMTPSEYRRRGLTEYPAA